MSAPRMGVTNAYSSSVLVGNWSEDQALHSLKISEFLHRKASHQLLIQQVDTQQRDALQEVGLSFSRDSYVALRRPPDAVLPPPRRASSPATPATAQTAASAASPSPHPP